jgi:hypothetical protein
MAFDFWWSFLIIIPVQGAMSLAYLTNSCHSDAAGGRREDQTPQQIG